MQIVDLHKHYVRKQTKLKVGYVFWHFGKSYWKLTLNLSFHGNKVSFKLCQKNALEFKISVSNI